MTQTTQKNDDSQARKTRASEGQNNTAQGSETWAAPLARTASNWIQSELDKRTERGAKRLSSVADILRKSGHELENETLGSYAEKAADQLDRASLFIRRADAQRMMQTAITTSKRQPWLFFAGAVAVGLAGVFLLKNAPTAGQRSTQHRTTRSQRSKPEDAIQLS